MAGQGKGWAKQSRNTQYNYLVLIIGRSGMIFFPVPLIQQSMLVFVCATAVPILYSVPHIKEMSSLAWAATKPATNFGPQTTDAPSFKLLLLRTLETMTRGFSFELVPSPFSVA